VAYAEPAASSKTPRESAATTVELTPALIKKRLKQVENTKQLEESLRKALLEKYTAALEHLEAGDAHAARAEKLRQETAEAPRQLEQVKVESAGLAAKPAPRVSPEMGLAEMQEALAAAEKAYAEAQKLLDEVQSEPQRRSDRRLEIPRLEDTARAQLEDLDKQRDPVPAGETLPSAAVAAERVLVSARRHALEHELEVYEEELRHFEQTVDLLEARRDHALAVTELAEQHLKTWEAAVNDRRRREAEAQVLAAQDAVRNAHPAIRRLADENATLATEHQELVARAELTAREQAALQSQIDVITTLLERVTERVKLAGLTESTGLLLRKQRKSIPDIAEHLRFIDERKAEHARLNLQLIDLEDRRKALADIDGLAKRLLSELRVPRNTKRALLEADLRKLLETTRDYLNDLITDTTAHLTTLDKLTRKEMELVERAREFSDFTSEYILWIRSAELPHPADAAHLGKSIQWMTASTSRAPIFHAYGTDLGNHPVAYVLVIIAVIALSLSQRIWRKLLRNAGRDAARHQATTIRPTVLAVGATALMSIGWPAALWLAGWRLLHLPGRTEFLVAFANGLEGAAALLITINLTRHVCRSFGLGESHFDWSRNGLQLIRESMWWLTAAGLPLAIIVLMTESQGDEAIKNSLGRLAFVAFQILLVTRAHRIWHSPQGLARGLSTSQLDRWWVRVCRLGQVASLGAPAALAVMALAGYYYTAVQLAQRLLISTWLVGGLLVLHATLLRWLLVAYRDLAMKRARERRADAEASGADRPPVEAGAEPTVRLSEINQQTHKLLGLAMYCTFFVVSSVIWVEVLPALAILDTVRIWPLPFAIVEESAKPNLEHFTLTLGELGLALLMAGVTVVAARNIPGLVEITILRHLKLDSGARYAVDAVTRYAITVLGMSLAFGRVGLGWKDVQWLVAAMTVGLGFGLQEIFANFASGLLLLFERPIRIGDTVSVGDVVGKVSRIRIRATTILDGDMRELIVPNKEFISGKVLNWTLTDTTSRMTIKVAVPFGSDPNLVKQLLLRVATSHPLVMKDPAPHALFDEFGDDTLNFTLRVYMASRDVYNQLRHELNAGINAAFQQAGIVKPAPEAESGIPRAA